MSVYSEGILQEDSAENPVNFEKIWLAFPVKIAGKLNRYPLKPLIDDWVKSSHFNSKSA